MDFEAYATGVVELVNRPLDSVDAIKELLSDRGWSQRRVEPDDVEVLQGVRARLAEVVENSVNNDEKAVVANLNSLLTAHPIRPQISGHDARSWHLHVADDGASAVEVLVSEALFGLALVVTEVGATRLGRCSAPGCGRAYLDTSHNRSRRYCSGRCATRVNVAAHRKRLKSTNRANG
ncbi:CGNR zinc finger domain-containing protein [Pseudonocardia sp. TRM90224]|uniref:CGNR zinc finger domain-containing protein n=1 Tax=Pseudonocardia sp. TRM90224 TaxID=2812678 RepID=UPI001E342505|nr:CGNR zinc finger domain-containing protein [Pseudonocardia sp. TRM90224]